MKFTKDWLKDYENKNNSCGHQSGNSGIQKQQDVDKKGTYHKPRNKKKNERTNQGSTLFINFRFRDYKRRDIDNCLSTLNDCMVDSGIIEGDSIKYISSILVCWSISKQPGVDIIIIEK